MKLTVNKTQRIEETVEIKFPSFFKHKGGEKFVALFGEDNAVRVWSGTNVHEISGYNTEFVFKIDDDVLSWEPISEIEFRLAYSLVQKTLSLPRRMVTTEELNEPFVN